MGRIKGYDIAFRKHSKRDCKGVIYHAPADTLAPNRYENEGMKFNPERHQRRSIRLKDYDYRQNGAYCVTLLTHQRECLFGDVLEDEMQINAIGRVVQTCWEAIPQHNQDVELDAFVIMPNHIHGIVVRNEDKSQLAVSSPGQLHAPNAGSLGSIIGTYKAAVSRQINRLNPLERVIVWHRNYHDHIIRDEHSLNSIRMYIELNPSRWTQDSLHPTKFQHGEM